MSSAAVPALARDGSAGSGLLTPKRPPRAPRALTSDGTPARSGGSGAAGKPSLAGHAERLGESSSTDYDLTPRKGTLLPTPPHSETTTSSGSGSGAARRGGLRVDMARSATQSSAGSSAPLSAGSLRRMKAADVQISPPASPPPSLGRGAADSRRSSTSTMRTVESRDDAAPARRAPPPAAAQNGAQRDTAAARGNAERMRRSARHEQEITQIRSESRAGRWDGDSDDEVRSRSTNGQLASRPSPGRRGTVTAAPPQSARRGGAESSTATDTSGTEGAGSAAGRRRRKKSSAASGSSNSRTHVAAARHARQQSTAASPADEWVRSDSRRSTLDYGPARRIISPRLGSEASTERFTGRFAAQWSDEVVSSPTEGDRPPNFAAASATLSRISPRRAPLPLEFREALPAGARQASLQSRFRSSSITSASEEQDTSTESIAGGSRNDGSYEAGSGLGSRRVPSSFARRRHASDAHELPSGDYDGRAGSQSSRLSVDSSSASRHLARTRHSASASGAPRSDEPERPPLSPSEIVRQRKVSSSSARSTGSASELLRTASRASSRLVHGRDVFDEAPAAADRTDRLNTLRLRQEQMRNVGTSTERRFDVDELRSQIDELAMTSTPRTDSRASSRASVRPASTFSARTHDVLGVDRAASRASFTEPRQSAALQRRRPSVTERFEYVRGAAPRNNEELGLRSASRASELPARRFTTTNDFSERAPATPDAALGRLGSQSAVLPSSARFASSTSSGSAAKLADANNMMHERNLQNAFGIFDRHFTGGPGTPATPSRGAESSELVSHFREVTAAATRINVDLRAVVEEVVQAQIDAELAESAAGGRSSGAAAAFERIDRALAQVLRQSDDQLRHLCDGLIAFTRAERERDRMRRVSENGSGGGGGGGGASASRPVSRMSLSQHTSPVRPQSKGDFSGRQAPPSRAGRHSPTASSTSEARSAHSHSSAGERAAAASSPSVRAAAEQRHRRHFTDAAASSAASAYASPTPAGLKLAAHSPTLNLPPRVRSTLSRAHSRAASDAVASASFAENGSSSGHRQRESTAGTVRPPPASEQLSPQRAKLSFPTVSAATATISRAADDSLSRAHARASEPIALAAAADAANELPGAASSLSRRNTISTSPATQRMSRDFTRPPRHDLMQPDETQDESGTSTQSASTMRRMLSLSRRR